MSTQDPSNIMTTKPLEDVAIRLFPEHWQSLEVVGTEDGTADTEKGPAKVRTFMLRCKQGQPSDDEVTKLVNEIKKNGDPVAWLIPLAYIEVPVFPEGRDPTVQEFFDGSYDPTDLSTECVIISYPYFLEST